MLAHTIKKILMNEELKFIRIICYDFIKNLTDLKDTEYIEATVVGNFTKIKMFDIYHNEINIFASQTPLETFIEVFVDNNGLMKRGYENTNLVYQDKTESFISVLLRNTIHYGVRETLLTDWIILFFMLNDIQTIEIYDINDKLEKFIKQTAFKNIHYSGIKDHIKISKNPAVGKYRFKFPKSRESMLINETELREFICELLKYYESRIDLRIFLLSGACVKFSLADIHVEIINEFQKKTKKFFKLI